AGVTLDRDGLARQIESWDAELSALESTLVDLGIVNPASATQVAAWLVHEWQQLDASGESDWLATWPRTPSGSLSTTAKHLKRLEHHLPGAELLVRYSKLAQLRSNFGSKLIDQINPRTGRLH